jgi:ABC-2 type transport system permease protein
MRKYLNIFKAEFMTNVQYSLNIALGAIGYLIFVVTFYYVWQYIYSDPESLINGYSMTQMVWYLMITELIYTSIKGRKIVRDVAKDVKGGNIAYNLNKPYSYVSFVLFRELGRSILTLLIQMVVGVIATYFLTGNIPITNFAQMLLIIISCILAQAITILLMAIIGLLSFKIDDSAPFYWLYSKFMILIGVIFPIEFFPEWAQKILVFTPIYVTSYGPSKLFVDFSMNGFVTIVLAQIAYFFVIYGLGYALYNSGVKKLNVNGG